MAISAKFLLFISILLSSIFISQASEWNTGIGYFYAKGSSSSSSLFELHTNNRKLVFGMKRGLLHVDGELRRVPSGPDPLHHNGGSPNKPKTTP